MTSTIYGKLNQIAKEIEYIGGMTNTATVHINDKVITVDANIDVDQIRREYTEILAKAEQLKGYFEEIQSEISAYESRFDAQDRKIEEFGESIKQTEKDIQDIYKRLSELEKEFEEIVDRKLEVIEAKLIEMDSDIQANTYAINKRLEIATYTKDKVAIDTAIANKGAAMYYDATGEYDPSGQSKSYWYMTSNNDSSNPKIISGPYNFGTGGGGGGGGGGGTSTKVHIEPVNWPTTVAIGSTVKLTVDWYSLKESTPTGNGTLALYIDGSLKLTQKNTPQGQVQIDVSSYLSEGTSSIEVRVTDAYGNSDKIIQTLTTVNIRLESLFDSDKVFSGSFKYIYTPYGEGINKIVHFVVDGKDIGKQEVTTSAEQQSYEIKDLTHGSHTLRVYFNCNIDGNLVRSNELFYDLIYEVAGNKTPIIASTFNELEQEQYTAFTVKYKVYTPDHMTSDIDLMVNGEVETSLVVNQTIQDWEYRPVDAGSLTLAIRCQNTYKTFNINVKESELDIHAVTEDLSLYLTATGRSNSEPAEQRQIWEDKDNHIRCDLQNFNFSSDGWIKDDNGNTVLKVIGDARVIIPYQPFAKDFTESGKTIELEFATSQINDYETPIISCWSAADSYTKSGVYAEAEDRKKRFDIELDINTYKKKIPTIGTSEFIYNTNWYLNGAVVNIAEYGLTLKERIIDPEAKEEDPYVFNGDKIIVTASQTNRGFYVTPQIAKIKSQQSELQTQYKEDEHVRVTFVVEKRVETRIMYMYINGVMSGAFQYPTSDNFRQLTPVNITIGSNDATVNIYNIRVYDNNLDRKQVVNNWIADTQSGELKRVRYLHNDNYNKDSGEIVISKLPNDLPYIIWDIDPLPQYKGDKRKGQAYYVDPVNSKKSFRLPTDEKGVGKGDYNVQGTSSSVYPVKNIRLKSKEGFIDNDLNVSKLWYVTDGGIGANYFTYKVDYASSEGANNVELTKLYNDASRSIGIYTPPQNPKLGGDSSKVRVGIDGFPIVAFHRTADGVDTFCTKANFNNDKANESVYGFMAGDESWEITNNSADEGNFKKPATPDTFAKAFEIRFPDEDGYSDLTHLQPMTEWVVSTDPDQATNKPLSEPKQFTYKTVVRAEDGTYSTKTVVSPLYTNDTIDYRLTKFKAELSNWFNVDSTVFYYIFTHLYLMIDSRAKNAFPTYFVSRLEGDGGDHWFWLPYDMDTAIGINNEGKLVFDYNLEDTDKIEGSNVFNGQDSVMWNNLRKMFDGEIGQMYSTLRTSGGLISFDETESRFSNHQAKWSENIVNEDSYKKYIKVLKETGDNYLEMLQGTKAQQRKWWLYNRFRYFDSKYLAGDAKSDIFQFRAYGKADVTITPYADIYATVSYANAAGAVVSVRASRGQSYTLPNPLPSSASDQETYIYSASQLKSVGDLSPFKPDTVKAANATRLQELKIGDNSMVKAVPAVAIKVIDTEIREGVSYFTRSDEAIYTPGYLVDAEGYKYTKVPTPVTTEIHKYYTMSNYGTDAGLYNNPNLRELTLGNNTLLKYLNVMNCTSLAQTIDIRGCTNIEEVYFDNTKITGINLPEGGILKTLHLPDTLTDLTIKNQRALKELEIAGTSNVQTLWLENMPMELVDVKGIIKSMPTGAEIRLVGIDETVEDASEIYSLYQLFDTMKGKTDQGITTDVAQVSGTIHIDTITYEDYTALTNWEKEGKLAYQDVKIEYVNLICKVRFFNDLEQYGPDQNIKAGNPAVRPSVDPTREPTAQYYYTFKDWDKDFSNVQTDLDIFAVYEEHIQTYEIKFDTQTTLVTVDSQFVDYGKKVQIPIPEPYIPGTTFLGWYTEPDTVNKYDFNKPVEGPFTLYGKWRDDNEPNVNIERIKFNKFKFTLTDNIAITHYAITNSEEVPTEWIEIYPSAEYIDYHIIDKSGEYYVWAKDASGIESHTVYSKITAYNITTQLSVGSMIDFSEEGEQITNFALEGTAVLYHASLDEHYENLILKINDVEAEASGTYVLGSDALFAIECNPKTYTVSFDIGKYGEAVEPQYIVYLHTVTEPIPQYVTGKVVDGWYTTDEFTKQWDFLNDVVTGDMTLYAKWIDYQEPSIITIFGGGEVRLNFFQSIPSGVEVDWGDGSPYERETILYNRVQLIHTYAEEKEYKIRLWCKNGVHYLGTGKGFPIVSPASYITDIEFAWNMATTSEYVLEGATNLTTLNIPRYMITLATGLCEGCTSLTTINLPSNLRYISAQAFKGCTGFKGEFEIPLNVIGVESDAFANCTGITTLKIHDSVILLGDGAFSNCTGLTSFVVPKGITEISSRLLYGCTGITEIDIPEYIEHVWDNAFNGCVNLEKLIYRNKNLLIDAYSINNCPKLTTAGPLGGGYDIEFTWEDEIPDHAFETGNNGSRLNHITIPNTIKRIGMSAFAFCQKLKNVDLHVGIEEIGASAFFWCDTLTDVVLPETLKSIGKNSFYRCYSLTDMVIPASVMTIGDNAFISCFSIREFKLYNTSSDNKIQSPALSWFNACSATTVIHIQQSVVDAVAAYGSCWNYYNEESTLKFYADL